MLTKPSQLISADVGGKEREKGMHVSHPEKFLLCCYSCHFIIYLFSSRNLIYVLINPDILFCSLQPPSPPETALLLIKQYTFPTSPTPLPDHANPTYFWHSMSWICRARFSEEALICNLRQELLGCVRRWLPLPCIIPCVVQQLDRRLSRYLTGPCYLSASFQLHPLSSSSSVF